MSRRKPAGGSGEAPSQGLAPGRPRRAASPGGVSADVVLGEVEEKELLAVQALMSACLGRWAPSRCQLLEMCGSRKRRIIVARRTHALGFVTAGPIASHGEMIGSIYSLGVHRRLRRQGLGSTLLAAAESWLAGMGVRSVRVLVPDGSPGVLTFFEVWGYTLLQVALGFYGPHRDGLLLVRSLACDGAPARVRSAVRRDPPGERTG